MCLPFICDEDECCCISTGSSAPPQMRQQARQSYQGGGRARMPAGRQSYNQRQNQGGGSPPERPDEPRPLKFASAVRGEFHGKAGNTSRFSANAYVTPGGLVVLRDYTVLSGTPPGNIQQRASGSYTGQDGHKHSFNARVTRSAQGSLVLNGAPRPT